MCHDEVKSLHLLQGLLYFSPSKNVSSRNSFLFFPRICCMVPPELLSGALGEIAFAMSVL